MNKINIVEQFLGTFKQQLGRTDALTDGLQEKIEAAATIVVAQLELVDRSEFDAQTKVLARTREKVEQLERRVKTLEAENLK